MGVNTEKYFYLAFFKYKYTGFAKMFICCFSARCYRKILIYLFVTNCVKTVFLTQFYPDSFEPSAELGLLLAFLSILIESSWARILINQFKEKLVFLISNHPWYLTRLACLQEEFYWVHVTRILLTSDVFSVIFHPLNPLWSFILNSHLPLLKLKLSPISWSHARPHCRGPCVQHDASTPLNKVQGGLCHSLTGAICKASSGNHFAILHFFFFGMALVTASCTMLQTSIQSCSGTLPIRSNPLHLFVTSTVKS